MVLLVSKSDSLQYWNEVWIVDLNLSVSDRIVRTAWREHFPRAPLPKGYVINDPRLVFLGSTSLVATLGGWGSGPAPAMLVLNLHRKKVWLYPPESPLPLREILLDSAAGTGGDEEALDAESSWFQCSKLTDCTALRDYCGELRGMRLDSVEEFRAWDRRQVGACRPGALRTPDDTPTLLCEEELCSIRWIRIESAGENLP